MSQKALHLLACAGKTMKSRCWRDGASRDLMNQSGDTDPKICVNKHCGVAASTMLS